MSIYTDHKPEVGAGNGPYLKLEDGQQVRIRIASEPVIYTSKFQKGEEVTLSTRYAWTVWNVDQEIPQVWQGSATFFKNLANFANDTEYGDPTEYDIKITREGTGTETQYHISPGRNSYKLSDVAKDACSRLDLMELVGKSPNNSSIFWLSDFINGTEPTPKTEEKPDPAASGYEKAKSKAAELKGDTKQDEVITEGMDDPISLEDIPF